MNGWSDTRKPIKIKVREKKNKQVWFTYKRCEVKKPSPFLLITQYIYVYTSAEKISFIYIGIFLLQGKDLCLQHRRMVCCLLCFVVFSDYFEKIRMLSPPTVWPHHGQLKHMSLMSRTLQMLLLSCFLFCLTWLLFRACSNRLKENLLTVYSPSQLWSLLLYLHYLQGKRSLKVFFCLQWSDPNSEESWFGY